MTFDRGDRVLFKSDDSDACKALQSIYPDIDSMCGTIRFFHSKVWAYVEFDGRHRAGVNLVNSGCSIPVSLLVHADPVHWLEGQVSRLASRLSVSEAEVSRLRRKLSLINRLTGSDSDGMVTL